MKHEVHILATVRKPELLEAATLVFRTLRVGFPTATVRVWGNCLDERSAEVLKWQANTASGRFERNLTWTSHDAWISELVESRLEPFWICDTDVVFWEPVENWFSDGLFAGRYEPEFDEEWTRTRHVARLHTAVMWINPGPVRSAMRAWMCRVPEPWRNSAEFPFIRQHFIPVRGGETLFYDTCAGLHQALGGTEFSEKQNAAFDHLHCATYADVVRLPGAPDLQAAHREIYRNPSLARGMRKQQDSYYKRRCPARARPE